MPSLVSPSGFQDQIDEYEKKEEYGSRTEEHEHANTETGWYLHCSLPYKTTDTAKVSPGGLTAHKRALSAE